MERKNINKELAAHPRADCLAETESSSGCNGTMWDLVSRS